MSPKINNKKRSASDASLMCEPDAKAIKSNNSTKVVVGMTGAISALLTPFSSFGLGTRSVPGVPAALRDHVYEVDQGVFHFIYKIRDLEDFRRLEWCVRDDVEEIIVRVAYPGCGPKEKGTCEGNASGRHWFWGDTKSYSFCVHLDALEMSRPHSRCDSVDEIWSGLDPRCGFVENFLTFFIMRELQMLLMGVDWNISLMTIHKTLANVIVSDPTSVCPICGRKMSTKCWRVGTCGRKKCDNTMATWPLGVRLSPLTRDPRVLDFLLTLCMSAAQPKTQWFGEHLTTKTLLPNCPMHTRRPYFTDIVDVVARPPVIDSFPELTRSTVATSSLIGEGDLKNERRQLLSWLCSQFKGCLIPAPVDTRVNFTGAAEQFLMLNHAPVEYTKFRSKMKWRSENCGSVAFHGTAATRAFSILSDALRTGSLNGGVKGVYYAHQPSYSQHFMHSSGLAGWKNSAFKKKMVMFGLELSGPRVPARNSEGFTMDESDVMIRYVFLIDALMTDNWDGRHRMQWITGADPSHELPRREQVEDGMLNTYRRIHSDTLFDPKG